MLNKPLVWLLEEASDDLGFSIFAGANIFSIATVGVVLYIFSTITESVLGCLVYMVAFFTVWSMIAALMVGMCENISYRYRFSSPWELWLGMFALTPYYILFFPVTIILKPFFIMGKSILKSIVTMGRGVGYED